MGERKGLWKKTGVHRGHIFLCQANLRGTHKKPQDTQFVQGIKTEVLGVPTAEKHPVTKKINTQRKPAYFSRIMPQSMLRTAKDTRKNKNKNHLPRSTLNRKSLVGNKPTESMSGVHLWRRGLAGRLKIRDARHRCRALWLRRLYFCDKKLLFAAPS